MSSDPHPGPDPSDLSAPHLAYPRCAADKSEEGGGFVVFRLGGRTLATGLDDVREVVRLQGLQSLPGTVPPLAGVLTVRGVPLPVLDIRPPEPGSPPTGDVLVVREGDSALGIAVDAVLAVVAAEELPVSGAPRSPALPSYVVGIRAGADGPVLQVDVRRLVSDVTGMPQGDDGSLADPAVDALAQ